MAKQQISARIDEHVMAEVDCFAVAERRTRSSALRVLLKAGLKATMPKQEEING